MTDNRKSTASRCPSDDPWCPKERILKLVGFYIVYYLSLFVIFKVAILATKATLPGNVDLDEARGNFAPKSQKMLHSPAMNILPVSQVPEKIESCLDLKNSEDTEAYAKSLETFFADYKEKIKFSEEAVNSDSYNNNCKAGNDKKICVPYTTDDITAIEDFCGKSTTKYGYDGTITKPCFIANVNKIINWQMSGLPSINGDISEAIKISNVNSTALTQNRSSGSYGCYAFKLKSDNTVDWESGPIDDSDLIQWSETPFRHETLNEPDNTLPSYFFPFRGNSKAITYNRNGDFGLTSPHVSKRNVDNNWLHPFRAFKIDLSNTAAFGDAIGLNFECNFYCANCIYTTYDSATKSMKYPDLITSNNAHQSQISFKIKFS